MNQYDYYLGKVKEYNNKDKEYREGIKNNINKIKSLKTTKLIKYPEYKEAFDYVYGLFPFSDVKEVEIYICSRRMLEKLGYKGVGGFFEKVLKTVIISDDLNFSNIKSIAKVKITTDEVIVHELLHYVSDTQKKKISSVEMEEEFAYGNSIGYLKSKGYSNEDIVENNFLPFLVQTIDTQKILKSILVKNGWDLDLLKRSTKEKQKTVSKKYSLEITEAIKTEARKKGLNLIEIYCPSKTEPLKIDNGLKDFDLLDI